MFTIHRYQDEEIFLRKLEQATLESIQKTLGKQKFCTLGLAGGSSPQALYERLACANLPWTNIRLIQIDERCVSVNDPESNQGMIQKALISKLPIPRQNLLFFDTALSQAEAAEGMNKELDALIKEEVKDQKKSFLFDLLILGAGPDGHVASLFEHDPVLQPHQWASPATAEGYKTETRLTLTLKALTRSQEAILLLNGAEKVDLVNHFQKFPILSQLLMAVPTKIFIYSPHKTNRKLFSIR